MPAEGHLPSLGNRLRNNAAFDPLRVLAQLHGFDLVAGTDISEGLETDLSWIRLCPRGWRSKN